MAQWCKDLTDAVGSSGQCLSAFHCCVSPKVICCGYNLIKMCYV